MLSTRYNKVLKLGKIQLKNENACPFNGECLLKNVYRATILNGNETKLYIGSTEVSFKARYTQHKQSITSGNSSQTPYLNI